MARNRPARGSVVGVCIALLILATAGSAAAQNQSQSNSSSSAAQAPASPDFMLGRPRVMIGARGSWNLAAANSDIYDFFIKQLTIDKKHFNMPTGGAEIAVSVAPRLDIVFGVEGGRAFHQSEYRDKVEKVGNKFLPINQTTRLRQMNLSGGIKFALTPKGRSVSRFAWVPRGITPYVGAGAGIVQYNLEQIGDFVDFQDDHIFSDSFYSSAWSPSANVFGGVDIQVYRHLYMSFEGKYAHASGRLEQKFVGFDPIDLSGIRFGGGFHVVF
jgi:opacity protein-like surface antigen